MDRDRIRLPLLIGAVVIALLLGLVAKQPRPIPEIVANAYPGLDPRLTAAAGGSVYAHLLDLKRRGLVAQEGELWTGTGSDSRS